MTSKPKRIIYSRGFPYGAPMVWLRGGGTRDEAVKSYLKTENGDEKGKFWWDSGKHAWESAMYKEEFRKVLCTLRDMGYEVVPKEGMDPDYIIDLDAT